MKDLQKLIGSLNKSGALSGFLGGVTGGGLTRLLGSKSAKSTGTKALKLGALAAVGGVAWKAYQQYSASTKTEQQADQHSDARAQVSQGTVHREPATRTFDFTPAVMPKQSFDLVTDDSNGSGQLILMRAMIAAAYADGHIDETERQKIFAQVESMELSLQEKAMLFDELRKPMTLFELVQAVPDAQTGIEVYAASVSAIDLQQPLSGQYLDALANQLCLPRELVNSIHQQLAAQSLTE